MFTALTIVGGLALFQYGVRLMSEGMSQLVGGKLQEWLDKATNHPVKGAAFGFVATALLRSSGLLMVTMIGLLNANLLSLDQAIGVMLGQEIGTTVTAQIVAYDVGVVRYVAIVLGLLFMELGRARKWQGYGQFFMGFGLVFSGMEMMTAALTPLAVTPFATQFLSSMGQNPFLGVLAGLIVTAVVNSSSATTGLVVAMGASHLIDLPSAIGLIYGANIGSCVTGFLASLRASVAGRRASVAQITINVIGVLLFMPFITPYASLIAKTSDSLPRQIANAHSVFNVVVSLVLFPAVGLISRWTKLVVRERKVDEPRVTQFLDDNMLKVPSIAIKEVRRETTRMGKAVQRMIDLSERALLDRDKEAAREVLSTERELIDPLCDAIEHFVDAVIADNINADERNQCFQVKNANVDLERVGDHTENMAEAALEIIKNDVQMSKRAISDLRTLFEQARRLMESALNAWQTGEPEIGLQTAQLEDAMDRLALDARQAHMKRIEDGKCNPAAGVIFVETLRNLERIGDHADNIAVGVIRGA
jgi:phosphate:Na+ symporter